jgi:hypothetical protein
MKFTMPWNASRPSKNWAAAVDDIKSQIGQQLERLAKLASDVGNDVAAQAAQATSDTSAQVGSAARDISNQALRAGEGARTQAATVARDVPAVGGTLAQQAMRGAAQLGRDLRSIRITKEPPPQQRGPDLMPGIALLAGVGSGLAIMYFLDPNEGRRRRALLRDQIVKWTRIGRESAEGKAKDIRNRAVGVMYEARKTVAGKSEAEEEMDTIATATRSRTQGNGAGANDERTEQQVTSEIV